MNTYPYQNGDQLIELVEKREYDLLVLALHDMTNLLESEKSTRNHIIQKSVELERELNAAVKVLEMVWPFLEEDDGDGANMPAYQAAINAVKTVITSKKGEQP